jgi:hypothetical protein
MGIYGACKIDKFCAGDKPLGYQETKIVGLRSHESVL